MFEESETPLDPRISKYSQRISHLPINNDEPLDLSISKLRKTILSKFSIQNIKIVFIIFK